MTCTPRRRKSLPWDRKMWLATQHGSRSWKRPMAEGEAEEDTAERMGKEVLAVMQSSGCLWVASKRGAPSTSVLQVADLLLRPCLPLPLLLILHPALALVAVVSREADGVLAPLARVEDARRGHDVPVEGHRH